jgi:hypothetical protein
MIILTLSLPPIRNLALASKCGSIQDLAPRIMRWLHRFLGLLAATAVYTHISVSSLYTKVYIGTVTTFSVILVLECGIFFHHNGAFANGNWTRVSVIVQADKSKHVIVYPGRAIHVHPGQFIKLWVPFANPLTWFDFRRFYVQTWEPGVQQRLQLFERAEGRFSQRLADRATRFLRETDRRRAFFIGPYGVSEPYTEYETILVIASDLGILSMMAHVRHLCHCIHSRTSKARRIRLVWELPGMSKLAYTMPTAQVAGKTKELEAKFEAFSNQVDLPTKLVRYHLGRYVPTDEEEQGKLVEDIIKRESLIEDLQGHFKRFEDEIKPLETEIARLRSGFRLLDNILCWVNSKFDDIKNDCVRKTVLLTTSTKGCHAY